MTKTLLLLLLLPICVLGLLGASITKPPWYQVVNHYSNIAPLSMALGDITVELEKPLGIILEEREAGKPGVQVESLVDGGAAETGGIIAPGDVLLQVNEQDVSAFDLDSVMSLVVSTPDSVQLTLSDGLGRMDIAPNLAKQLSPQDASLVDSVVRAAVRELRRNGRLGSLLKVEIVIGAGVQDNGSRCLVRFFAIFSTDGGGTTYSCNVSATGVKRNTDDTTIDIVALSCAKDEGLGQTIDLILEKDR